MTSAHNRNLDGKWSADNPSVKHERLELDARLWGGHERPSPVIGRRTGSARRRLRYIVFVQDGEDEGVPQVRDIAKLLFGDDDGGLLDLFAGNDSEDSGMAERARRAGEWCGTTPGHDWVENAARRASRTNRIKREVIIREFRDK